MNRLLLLAMLFCIMPGNQAKAEIYKEPFEDGVYIVDGDIPVADLSQLEELTQPSEMNKLIVSMISSRVYNVWGKSKRHNITYCISDKFKSRKKRIIAAMNRATLDWMEVANVKFIYIKEQDFNCDQKNELVTFDVRPVSSGRYLARAFFPNSKRAQRNIMVDSSSFRLDHEAMDGILRHELGHVLGFRHEHIHTSGNGSCREGGDFKPLTQYDKGSVMHYPQCGGTGNIKRLVLTASDKKGAGIVYPF